MQFLGNLFNVTDMNKQITFSRSSRRQFIKYGTLAAGAAVLTGPYPVRGQNLNSKLNLGQVGCAGKGWSDGHICAAAGENVKALCDINAGDITNMTKSFHDHFALETTGYKDYRDMLEKEKDLDAIDIAVPDHMHAVIAATAIKMGKNVYCQKPLTHDVFEARAVAQPGSRAQCGHANGQPGQRFGFIAPRGRSDARRH